jgi:hypothetical protein
MGVAVCVSLRSAGAAIGPEYCQFAPTNPRRSGKDFGMTCSTRRPACRSRIRSRRTSQGGSGAAWVFPPHLRLFPSPRARFRYYLHPTKCRSLVRVSRDMFRLSGIARSSKLRELSDRCLLIPAPRGGIADAARGQRRLPRERPDPRSCPTGNMRLAARPGRNGRNDQG